MAAKRRGLDKKRTVLLLRTVVAISTSYLILFGQPQPETASAAYILALILSNVALMLTPREWFHKPRFSAVLLLGDTSVVLVGLYLTVGCFSQDFLIIYFFTIFLTTATESIAQIAVGAAMISGLYGYWLWITATHPLAAGEWLRLPFFFIVAVFYAYVTEETKQERWRRQQAERDYERLRFLLNVSDAFSQPTVTQQMIRQLAGIIQGAFPRLQSEVVADTCNAGEGTTVLPVTSQGRSFGALRIRPIDEIPLSTDEEQFCRLVVTVAASALLAAEQTTAAQEGTRLTQEFLSTLSHELRSPLHVILGNADILTEELRPHASAFVLDSIDRLRAGGVRLLDLVEELLCFAEVRAGKAALFVEWVEVRDLFDELALGIREQLKGRPVVFECDVASDIPPLQTDRRKLRLIVSAVLNNAVKFTEKGFIRLHAEIVSNAMVEITVHDSGIGIPPDLAKLFQPFRQLDASLKRRFSGLGLGLALTQELALALGGRIDVESEPGRGSIFRVHVPLALNVENAQLPARITAVALPAGRPALAAASR